MRPHGRATNVIENLFSGRTTQSCSAAEPLTPAVWSGSLFSGRAAQSCSAASRSPLHFQRPSRSRYMNARAFFVRTRAHETRDLSIRQNNVNSQFAANELLTCFIHMRISAKDECVADQADNPYGKWLCIHTCMYYKS